VFKIIAIRTISKTNRNNHAFNLAAYLFLNLYFLFRNKAIEEDTALSTSPSSEASGGRHIRHDGKWNEKV
jgi:hypothetical protein